GIRGFRVTGVQTCALPIFGLGSLMTSDSAAQSGSDTVSATTQASPADIQNAKSLSRAFRDVSKALRPSVVSISSVKNVKMTSGRSEERRAGKAGGARSAAE